MARTVQKRFPSRTFLGKRKRSNGSSFKAKRRRFGKKSSGYNTRSLTGGGLRFKSRKFSRRRYNNILWTSTMFKRHFRSTASSTAVFSTPITQVSMNMGFFSSRRPGGFNFFDANGGAINPDGGLMPAFAADDDIVVRGGMIGFRMCNKLDLVTSSETVQVNVFLVRTGSNFNGSLLAATVNVGWDPSLIPDFQRDVGKIIMRRKYLLRDNDVATEEYRLPIQKIDITNYVNTFHEYIWVVMVGNPDSTAVRSIQFTGYHNLSFVGDVV